MPAVGERRKSWEKSGAWIYFYFITVIVAHSVPPFPPLGPRLWGDERVGGFLSPIAVMWLLRKDTWSSLSLWLPYHPSVLPGFHLPPLLSAV